MNFFAYRLNRLRKENRMTQEKLAAILRISRSSIAAWEQGRNEPNIQMLIAISEYFGVSVDFLIGKQPCGKD